MRAVPPSHDDVVINTIEDAQGESSLSAKNGEAMKAARAKRVSFGLSPKNDPMYSWCGA